MLGAPQALGRRRTCGCLVLIRQTSNDVTRECTASLSFQRNKVGAPALRYMLHERRVVFEVAFCHLAPSVSEKLFLNLGRRRLGNRFYCMIGVGRDDLLPLPPDVCWVLAILHRPD